MASTNATDNFIQPMATFKGKEYRSEIADDFPNAMFVAKTCCDWLCKKKKKLSRSCNIMFRHTELQNAVACS